jgi:hypothetical protein
VLPSNYAVTGDGRTSQTIGFETTQTIPNAVPGVKPIAPSGALTCGKFPRPVAEMPQGVDRIVSPRESLQNRTSVLVRRALVGSLQISDGYFKHRLGHSLLSH